MNRILAQKPVGGELKPIGPYSPAIKEGTDVSGVFAQFASNLIGFLTVIAGIWFLLQFLLGGLKWISAGGDSNKVEEAKKQLTNAAIGLIVVVASISIVFIVGKVLGLSILSPSKIIDDLTPAPSNQESLFIPSNTNHQKTYLYQS